VNTGWQVFNNYAAGATYRKVTAKTVNNTTTETDLLNGEITIAAGILGASNMLRLVAKGDWLNNAGRLSVARFKLKLGSTVLFDTGTSVGDMNATATRYGWRVEAEVVNLGITNSQSCSFVLDGTQLLNPSEYSGSVAFATGEGSVGWLGEGGSGTARISAIHGQAWNSGSVDTTVNQGLALTVILPTASASYEVKLYDAVVQII